jgi:hypothetical protein
MPLILPKGKVLFSPPGFAVKHSQNMSEYGVVV